MPNHPSTERRAAYTPYSQRNKPDHQMRDIQREGEQLYLDVMRSAMSSPRAEPPRVSSTEADRNLSHDTGYSDQPEPSESGYSEPGGYPSDVLHYTERYDQDLHQRTQRTSFAPESYTPPSRYSNQSYAPPAHAKLPSYHSTVDLPLAGQDDVPPVPPLHYEAHAGFVHSPFEKSIDGQGMEKHSDEPEYDASRMDLDTVRLDYDNKAHLSALEDKANLSALLNDKDTGISRAASKDKADFQVVEHKAEEFVAEQARHFTEKKKVSAKSKGQQLREFLTLYRVFHLLILVSNTVGIGYTLAHRWDVGQRYSATFALGNVAAALVVRNEVILYGLYLTLLFLFKRWPPIWFRDALVEFLLHLGGAHSGFAVSGTLWLLATTIELFRKGGWIIDSAVFVVAVISSGTMVAIVVAAWPTVRYYNHNFFENTHRWAGWASIAILWVFIGLADSWDTEEKRYVASNLKNHPDCYIAIALTALVVLPWTTVRKQPVKCEVLSNAVVLIRFPGGYGPGLFTRISRRPLKENHAFGLVSFGPQSNEHYICAVGQGDFTRGLIEKPPTHLWSRQFKFVGVPRLSFMYNSGLYLVTGTAIAVALPVFFQRDPKSRWHLLWISANIEKTYKTTVLKDLRDAFNNCPEDYDKLITIWDTRVRGRPNIVKLVQDIVVENGLETVVVTSNPKGTAEVMRGCKSIGVSAHGPVWDS